MAEPWLVDHDLEIHVGDCRDVLRAMPDESVHCVVTSPPYWNLRSYLPNEHENKQHELGGEPTPEEYVANMVDVFREVRRVIRHDATCWINLGDTFVDKQLQGVPWRVALALQDDGWILRSDIIWNKVNALPSSVRDRPTTAHEYIFMLSKSRDYFYDVEAVKEDAASTDLGILRSRKAADGQGPTDRASIDKRLETGLNTREGNPSMKRNLRSVWSFVTSSGDASGNHYAAFPEELPRRPILAGTSEKGCCPECGSPWVRVLERMESRGSWHDHSHDLTQGMSQFQSNKQQGTDFYLNYVHPKTIGWEPSCSHGLSPVPCAVMDPFGGSGTTALVARSLGRRSVLVELNVEYAKLAAGRLSQLSLLV